MVECPSASEVALAAVAGVAGVAGSYATAGYTRSFVVAPIDALVVRATPGAVVAWTIQTVGEAGHLVHLALSLALAVALVGTLAMAGLALGSLLDRPLVGAGLAGLLAWTATAGITGRPAFALGAGVPVAAVLAVGTLRLPSTAHDPSRRRVLRTGAGVLGFVGLAGVARTLASGSSDDPEGRVAGAADVETLLELADDRSLDVAADGVPGLVSSIEEFYNVDIAEFDPRLPAEDWSLAFTGAVDDEVAVTFADLTEMPTEHRYVTLRCVGESLNGRKMDTAVWTGTPIAPLLERVDPGGACGCAMVRAADGYYVQFPVAALEDAFLAWGMNGRALPESHGHPVRLLVPGHWGETNVKWLGEIELLDEAADGYWEERGWHGTGPVNTVAKLWGTAELPDGRLELAGHAYAGTRGVDRVEVSTDGGDTWTDAELSEPLPGEDVWRQWRYAFEPTGTHEAVVRATDGDGELQPAERADAFPSGATGWVSRTVGGG